MSKNTVKRVLFTLLGVASGIILLAVLALGFFLSKSAPDDDIDAACWLFFIGLPLSSIGMIYGFYYAADGSTTIDRQKTDDELIREIRKPNGSRSTSKSKY